MVIRWGEFSSKSSTALTTGWLITAGVGALYLGVIQPHHQARGIASEKGVRPSRRQRWCGLGANRARATNFNSSAPLRSLPSKRHSWRRSRGPCRRHPRLSVTF